MSQRGVERVIGKLMTDEAFRRHFSEDPAAAMRRIAEGGVELTECERHALAGLNTRLAGRFAETVDPRLQKTNSEEAGFQ